MTHRAPLRSAAIITAGIRWYPLKAASAAPSWAENVVTFIDAGQENIAEVERPDPVINLVEADDLLLERVRDEEQPFLEPDRWSLAWGCSGPGTRSAGGGPDRAGKTAGTARRASGPRGTGARDWPHRCRTAIGIANGVVDSFIIEVKSPLAAREVRGRGRPEAPEHPPAVSEGHT